MRIVDERDQSFESVTRSLPALSLYRWQEEALSEWRQAWHRGVVQAVTGAGKTRVGLAAIELAHQRGRQAVVLVPSLALAKQWVVNLRTHLPQMKVRTDLNSSVPWDVTVTTVQSAMNRASLTAVGGLLVADECHRYGAESFALALSPAYTWRLGLSATFQRNDLGDEVLRDYFAGVCFDLGYQRATADRLISPFKVAFASVPLSSKERTRYVEVDAELKHLRQVLVQRFEVVSDPVGEFLKGVSALAEDRDPSSGGGVARRYMARFSERKSLLAETQMKYMALAGVSPAVHGAAGTIVFTHTQKSAEEAAEVLGSTGCSAAAVHAEHPIDERESRVEMLRTGEITALTAPRVLDEGIDVPDADLGIILASNRSRRQMIQRLGRVLRRRDQKLARFLILYAEGTVEDPFASGAIPDFYDECLPFAVAERRFDLGANQLPQLLEFLGVSADATSARVGNEIVEASGERASGPAADEDARLAETEPVAVIQPTPEVVTPFSRFLLAPPAMFARCTADVIHDYLHTLRQYPLLSAEEEVHLSKAIEVGLYARHLLETGGSSHIEVTLEQLWREGELAFQWMVVSNLRLVVNITKGYVGQGLDFEDLIQAGTEGLVRAVHKFDFTRGLKFSTYATWWIKQSVTRTLADEGRLVRLPVHFVEKLRPVDGLRRRNDQTWAQFLLAHPEGLTDLEVSGQDLRRMATLSRSWLSTEWLTEEVADSWVASPVGGADGDSAIEACVDIVANHAQVHQILAELTETFPVGVFVLKARHGLLTGEPETLDTIGRMRGVTRERIRQIEKQALELLTHHRVVPATPPEQKSSAKQKAKGKIKATVNKGAATRGKSIPVVRPAALSKSVPTPQRERRPGLLSAKFQKQLALNSQGPAAPRRALHTSASEAWPTVGAAPRRALLEP
ncbi:sigma-70 family RNA polymerase sigma factor [Aestuariimicrobium kwangyangense]|uniref:sigma-70 family RNA polymerase sigma factor n=1 Tax=Aestuariimicrobium kwangyangense TaxID=396389 RepID=UPI000428C652|nr:sigma-70 family RNA polymerase sigma factor [Aestuariimicrobium kwangyangense]